MQKLYCYVDETGQDTGGALFSVCSTLLAIERESRKRNKWQKTDDTVKLAFLNALLSRKSLLYHRIFIQHFFDTKNYVASTAEAIERSIRAAGRIDCPALIYIDGLRKHEVGDAAVRLRARGVRTEKVKGVRKDENNAFIRLSDAVAGFVRDYLEGQDYARKYFRELIASNVITET